MSTLDKWVKVEMIKDVPPEDIVDLMDKYHKENKELKGDISFLLGLVALVDLKTDSAITEVERIRGMMGL